MAPESIVDHSVRAVLEFRWADGTEHLASYQLLRSSCPCADCKAQRAAGYDGQARKLPSTAVVRLTDIRPVGAYGVQFVFGDGHDRGIFPWRFLRELLDKTPTQAVAAADHG